MKFGLMLLLLFLLLLVFFIAHVARVDDAIPFPLCILSGKSGSRNFPYETVAT